MNAHTPGPWTVSNVETASGIPLYLIEQERISEDRSEANARLMEAAPELLAALRLTMTALVICKARSESTFDIQGILDQAEAAMDRATNPTADARGDK